MYLVSSPFSLFITVLLKSIVESSKSTFNLQHNTGACQFNSNINLITSILLNQHVITSTRPTTQTTHIHQRLGAPVA